MGWAVAVLSLLLLRLCLDKRLCQCVPQSEATLPPAPALGLSLSGLAEENCFVSEEVRRLQCGT